MPLIVVYNLTPKELKDKQIAAIESAIRRAVLALPELELERDDIMFSFPQDPSSISGKVPVTIIVELLFEKPKRTDVVRHRLATAIARAFAGFQGDAKREVVVAVKRFNPEKDGFCAIEP